jgi:nucleotide-binding universal stress UspA family protein
MYSKLLVPLDGSRFSEAILPYALTFAKTLHVPVDLLHVIEPERVEVESARVARSNRMVEAELREINERYLTGVARSFGQTVTVRAAVQMGNPPEVIVDRGAAEEGVLIAMSTHGRSGFRRWYLGSVTEKVLHASKDPLLIVRGKEQGASVVEEASLKTILVPLDGSPLAERVLPHVAAVARELKLKVVLMRVYSLAALTYTEDSIEEGSPIDVAALTDTLNSEVQRYLEVKAAELKDEGVQNISREMFVGDAAGKIVDLAHQVPDSLVAMCTHGRSGIKRWVLGNITDRVVRHCGSPVLVVRSSTPAP